MWVLGLSGKTTSSLGDLERSLKQIATKASIILGTLFNILFLVLFCSYQQPKLKTCMIKKSF